MIAVEASPVAILQCAYQNRLSQFLVNKLFLWTDTQEKTKMSNNRSQVPMLSNTDVDPKEGYPPHLNVHTE